MNLIKIERTPNEPKEFKAVFDINGKTKATQFGTPSNYETVKTTLNVIEYMNNPTSAGALSRFILWGDYKSTEKYICIQEKIPTIMFSYVGGIIATLSLGIVAFIQTVFLSQIVDNSNDVAVGV